MDKAIAITSDQTTTVFVDEIVNIGGNIESSHTFAFSENFLTYASRITVTVHLIDIL